MSRLGYFTHMLQPWFCSGSCLMELLVRMWVSHSLSLDSCLRPYHETGTCLVIAQWACGCFGSCLLLTQVQAIVLSKSSEFPVGITCMTQIFSCCVACVMVHLWTMCQHESLHIVHYSCVEKNTRYQWFIYWRKWCPFFKAVHKNALKMLKKSTLSQQTGAIYVKEQEAQQYIESSRCKLLPCIFAV